MADLLHLRQQITPFRKMQLPWAFNRIYGMSFDKGMSSVKSCNEYLLPQ